MRTVASWRCGCFGSVIREGTDPEVRLTLCADHSRWIQKAKEIVVSGQINEVTIRATVQQ